jgi:hypothetical protein
VKLALLEPGAIERLEGLKVTVPLEVLVRATIRLASVVIGLPNASCRCTVMLPEAEPAVRVTGEVVKTNLLGEAALTLMPAEIAEDRLLPVKVSVAVPALVTYNPLKVATPLEGVAVCASVVAFRLPPLVSAAVMAVAYEGTVLP